MNIPILIIASLMSFGLSAQAIPKRTPMPAKVYSGKPVAIIDPARENPVMVLYGNHRTFVKKSSTVTDTLSSASKYRVLTNNDSIKRYSDSKFVRQVLIITP